MKKWINGYNIPSGFKVEYEEYGVEDSMIFPTESEANEYFEEEKSEKEEKRIKNF